MDKMLFTTLVEKELQDLIYTALKKALSDAETQKNNERFLSAIEARKLFKPEVSPTTLWRWSHQGLIKKHYFGKKAYYKYTEILEAAKTLKRYHRNSLLNL